MNILNWLLTPLKKALETMDELETLLTVSPATEPEPGWADGMPIDYTEEE
jgi:hypothetical protein